MNTTQIQTTVAPLVTFAAGVLAGKGLFGLDATAWASIIGGAVAFGGTIWAAVATKKQALVTTVAQMPEVRSVTLEPGAQTSLSQNTPPNVGTPSELRNQ